MGLTFGTTAIFFIGIAYSLRQTNVFHDIKFFLFQSFAAVALMMLAWRWRKTKSISAPRSFFWIFWAFCLSQSKTVEALVWVIFTGALLLLIEEEAVSLAILEALGIPLVIYGLIQHFGADPIRWNPGGERIFSFLGNADICASVLAILIAITAVQSVFKPGIGRPVLLFFESAALYWTYSRGGLAALFVSDSIFVLLIFVLPGFRCWRLRTLASTFLIISTIFFCHRLMPRQTLAGRYSPETWHSDSDIQGRLYLMKKGMELVALHPWQGVGPGNFKFAYLLLRRDNPAFYRNRIALPESTHNTFLDVFVESGMMAGIAFLALWVWGGAALLMQCIQRERTDLLVVLIGLISLFVSLQFTFPDPTLKALSAFFIAAAAALCSEKKRILISQNTALLVLLLVSVVSIFSILDWAKRLPASAYTRQGIDAMESHHPEEAVGYFRNALFWNPWVPDVWQRLGKSEEESGDAAHALLYYSQAVKLQKENPYYWAGIGRLAAINRWQKCSLTAYAEALHLDPYDPIFLHDAAVSAYSFGRIRLAQYYAKEERKLNSLP